MASSPSTPGATRPKRFALELPLEFRPQDSDHWLHGKTENISANGMLFRTRRPVAPFTPIEIKLQLPPGLTGEGVVRLLCSGYVVRSIEPELPFKEPRIAATFLHAQLANGRAGVASDLRHAQLLAVRGEVGKLMHRLNSLLFIILGNAELTLLQPHAQSKVRNCAQQTRQAAEEATALVRSLGEVLK